MPIVLGTFIITAHQPDASRIYTIIFVVVAFSVIVQGGLVPAIASRLGVPMRQVEPTPFTAGIRLRYEPQPLPVSDRARRPHRRRHHRQPPPPRRVDHPARP